MFNSLTDLFNNNSIYNLNYFNSVSQLLGANTYMEKPGDSVASLQCSIILKVFYIAIQS